MNTAEVIKELQTLDPTGKAEVVVVTGKGTMVVTELIRDPVEYAPTGVGYTIVIPLRIDL